MGNFSGYRLCRRAKVDAVKSVCDTKNIIFIQAKPGQGKTFFAKEAAEACYDKSVYYQMTAKDRDPVHFCISLHRLFSASFQKYSCPDMDEAVKGGQMYPYEAESYIRLVIKSLRKILLKKTVVIIDDLHLLPDIGLSCMAVLTAVSHSGGMLSFILCARSNCQFPEKFSRLNKSLLRLDDDFLMLTKNEFADLAVNMLEDEWDFRLLDRVYQMTEGWINGVVTVFENIQPNRPELLESSVMTELFSGYFLPLTEKYDRKHFPDLLVFSLFEQFDIDFMKSLDNSGKTAAILQDMLSKNLFVSMSGQVVRFHKIFRYWLKSMAVSVFTRQAVSDYYIKAHLFEQEHGSRLRSLEYLILSEDYERLEAFVKANVFELSYTEHSSSLFDAFALVPVEELKNRPWTALLYSMMQTLIKGCRTPDIFLHTYDKFESLGDINGMLAAACGLVCSYCTFEGNLAGAAGYYRLIKDGLKEKDAEKTSSIQLYIANAIGAIYMDNQADAVSHLDKAMSKLETTGYQNIRIRIYGAYIHAYLAIGDRVMAEKYCDAMILKLNTSGLSYAQKLMILQYLTYFASVNGMFATFKVLSDLYKRKGRLHIETEERSAAIAFMCEADYFMSQGKYEEAQRVINMYSESRIRGLYPHTASVIYGMKALVMAYGCDISAAELAEKASALRAGVPSGSFYVSFTNYFAGAVYALLSNHKKAVSYLTAAAEQDDNLNIAAASYAYLSYLYNNIGDRLRAREFAVYAVKYFMRLGSTHFIGLLPEISVNMYSYAVNETSASSFAANAAYESHNIAFDSLGRIVPVLEITVLDGLKMKAGTKSLDCLDMSLNFRLMLAVLLSSPGYSLEQELMQTYIWPESNREHARKSLDNLVSRFRKMLGESFAGINPKDYLTLNNGILRLNNIKCDAEIFLTLNRKAKDNYSKGEYTACMDKLIRAEALFHNQFFPGINTVTAVAQKRRDIDLSFISMLKLIQRLSFFLPDVFDPAHFFDKWLDVFMGESEMVSMAYKYYISVGRHEKCREIIKDYKNYMKYEGYSEEEISELIYLVKTAM